MSEKQEIEKFKKVLEERGIDIDAEIERKKEHLERMDLLNRQLSVSRNIKIQQLKLGE